MDDFAINNPTIRINNGVIDEISFAGNNTFVTVSYNDRRNRGRRETIRLVVSRDTRIFDENGRMIRASELRRGMIIDATHSAAVTRSIPPQAAAITIRIVRRPVQENIIIGRIIDIDRQNRNFTTISNNNLSSIIRFNVPNNAIITDRNGRPMNFSRLTPGTRVWVRHADFMTASIPPQTTAFEVRVM